MRGCTVSYYLIFVPYTNDGNIRSTFSTLPPSPLLPHDHLPSLFCLVLPLGTEYTLSLSDLITSRTPT